MKRKRFIYVLEGSFIFYLYFLNALIITVVSLNVRSVFLDVLAYFLLFFIPILGLYLLVYMIVNSCGNGGVGLAKNSALFCVGSFYFFLSS